MRSLINTLKKPAGLIAGLGVMLSLLTVVPAAAQGPHCGENLPLSGTISGRGGSIGLFIGYRWGKGILKLNDGREYAFHVRGIKMLEHGAATEEVDGEVYNLTRLEDFIGHYYGSRQGMVPVKGEGDMVMNNSRCVVIVARSKGTGVRLSPPTPEGVTIRFSDDD